MNKEDKFIKELLYVGLGEEALEETTYLKNIVTKSDIVKNLLNELKSISTQGVVFLLFLVHCEQLNLNYKSFLYEQSFDNRLLDLSVSLRKLYDKKNKDEKKTSGLNTFYESIYNLYDSQETKWLKEIIDLKSILSEMNRNKYNFLCPICQSQLDESFEKDHFLPRSIFPTLTISSENFTPICKRCNSAEYKSNNIPKLPILLPNMCNPVEEYIDFIFVEHNVSTTSLFSKELTETGINVSSLSFFCDVIPEEKLSPEDKDRTSNLIDLFKLRKRFNQESFKYYLSNDIDSVIREVEFEVKEKQVGKTRNAIEAVMTNQLNTFIRRLEQDGNAVYRKYRMKMLPGYFKQSKETYILKIMEAMD
ncbi:HNH endonuclease [Streptococcus suis]|uniref:HNH endonuclease n=1 Tax=Streptococcus suis TaxID=1307 RepID=UPI003756774D